MKFEKDIEKICQRDTSFADKGEAICRYIHKNISSIIFEKLSAVNQGLSLKIEVSKVQRLFEDDNLIIEIQHRKPSDINKLSTIKSSEYEKVLTSLSTNVEIDTFRDINNKLEKLVSKVLKPGEAFHTTKNSIIKLSNINQDTYFVVIFNKETITQTIKLYNRKTYLLEKEVSAISKDSRIKIWTNFILNSNGSLDSNTLSKIIFDESTFDLKIDLLKKVYHSSPNECLIQLEELSKKQDSFSTYSKKILKNLGREHA